MPTLKYTFHGDFILFYAITSKLKYVLGLYILEIVVCV